MEPEKVAIAIAVAAVAVVSLALWRLFFGRRKERRAFARLPGPRPTLVLGNLPEIVNGGITKAHQRWVRQYGDIFKCRMGCKEYLVVSSPDLIREICAKKFKSFRNRYVMEITTTQNLKGLIFGRDEYWASARSAVLPLFHGEQLQNAALHMNECARVLATRLERASMTGQVVPLHTWFQAMTLEVFGKAAFDVDFGLQEEDAEMGKLVRAVEDSMQRTVTPGISAMASMFLGSWLQFPLRHILSSIPYTTEWHDQRNYNTVDEETSAMLQERRRSADGVKDGVKDGVQENGHTLTRKDLLSLLAQARHKGTGQSLSDYEVVRLMSELVVAGYETTANTLAFAVLLLSSHPHIENRMADEIRSNFNGDDVSLKDLEKFPYVDMVVKETLRLFPTAAVLGREANEETAVGDLVVPAGSRIILPVFAIHRRPELFADPETFRPERFDLSTEEGRSISPYAYLPFGVGPRMCPGYKFAMQEACIALIYVYSRFTFSLKGNFASLMGDSMVKDALVDVGLAMKPRGGVHVTVNRRE